MARLAVAARERLVGDPADEVLEEAVLAALRRARVGLDAEHLLPHESGQERIELGLASPKSAASDSFVKVLPSTGGVLEQPPLLRGEPVEARGDEPLQRLGHLELRRPHR